MMFKCKLSLESKLNTVLMQVKIQDLIRLQSYQKSDIWWPRQVKAPETLTQRTVSNSCHQDFISKKTVFISFY